MPNDGTVMMSAITAGGDGDGDDDDAELQK